MSTSQSQPENGQQTAMSTSQSEPENGQQTAMSTSQSETENGQQTSGQPVSQPLTKEHDNAIKVFLIVDQEARPVMKEVFEAGAKSKDPNETLKDYLFRCKGMTNAQYRQTFNRTQREVIEYDPSCQKFDVSLWFQAIQQGCDGLAAPEDEAWLTSQTLENQLKRVKDFRNKMFHGDLRLASSDFLEKTEEIRTLLLDCLSKAREKFSLNESYIDKKISDLNARINFIRDSPFTELDLNMYDNSALFTGLQNILLKEGKDDLKNKFKSLIHVNPASTIAGQDIHVKVDAIFIPLAIIQAGRGEENLTIRYNDLIYEAHQKKQKDGTCVGQIILLEGVAGSGKTTLIKQLLSAWASNDDDVREINLYKFIIPIECRSRSYLELSNVISSLMPTAKKSFPNINHMQECVLDLPSIIIFDGLDEMNDVSERLFKEIMEIKNPENLTIICTTRPETIQDFYRRIPDDVNTMHIKIKGIAEKDIENFIYKYHEALKACGKSEQSTEKLLHYYRTRIIRLKDLFRCPLYASLMCILWAVAPDRENNITTETELLLEISHLSVEKLLERLTKHDLTKYLPIDTLKGKLVEFEEFLHMTALHCLRDDDDVITLNENAAQILKTKCTDLQLPQAEVLGAYLICENSWTSRNMEAQLSFPHKSLQEFYSSLYIYGKVTSNDTSAEFVNLKDDSRDLLISCKLPDHMIKLNLEVLQERLSVPSAERNMLERALSEALNKDLGSVKLNSFQNVFSILIGIFYHYGYDTDEELARELVDLLKKSAINNREQFVQVLNSVKCNDILVRLIADIPGIMEGTVEIRSHNTFAYASLFKIRRPQTITIKIKDDPSILPRLEELILTISKHQSQVVKIHLPYLFRHPEVSLESTSLEALGQMMQRYSGDRYEGSTFNNFTVSKSLKRLYVSIGSDQHMETFHSTLQSHQLDLLYVCVAADFNAEALKSLPRPRAYPPVLFIVDVTNELVENAALIAKRCQPVTRDKRFESIFFPRGNLDLQHQLDLIREMENMGITVYYDVRFPYSIIPPYQQQLLIKEEAKMRLRCQDVAWGGEYVFDGRLEYINDW